MPKPSANQSFVPVVAGPAVAFPPSPFIQHVFGKNVLKGSKTGKVVIGAQAVVKVNGPFHELN